MRCRHVVVKWVPICLVAWCRVFRSRLQKRTTDRSRCWPLETDAEDFEGDLGRAPLTVPRVGHAAASCLRGLHSEQVTKPCCPDASSISAHLNGPELERHPSSLEGLLLNETAPCWGSPAFAVTLCLISSLSKHAQH